MNQQAPDQAKPALASLDEEEKAPTPTPAGDSEEAPVVAQLKIICKDRVSIQASRNAMRQSVVIWQALESDPTVASIELHELDSASMQLAVDYMQYHETVPSRTIPMPLSSTDMREMVDGWDADFLEKLDQEAVMRLLLIANYMNIPNLMSLLCAKLASLMKGRTPREIRRTFNIREFTSEERDEMKQSFADLVG